VLFGIHPFQLGLIILHSTHFYIYFIFIIYYFNANISYLNVKIFKLDFCKRLYLFVSL